MRQHSRTFPLVLTGLMALGVLAGLTAAYKRFHIEARNRRVEIGIEWAEVLQLTQAIGKPAGETLEQFRQRGVNTLVLQEETITTLEQAGGIRPQSIALPDGRFGTIAQVDSPATLKRISVALKLRGYAVTTAQPSELNENNLLLAGRTAFTVADKSSGAVAKSRQERILTAAPPVLVPASYTSLRLLGLGLPQDGIQAAKAADLRIAGRIGNFAGVNLSSAQAVLTDLKNQGASVVIFSGEETLGYRGLEKRLAELFQDPAKPADTRHLPPDIQPLPPLDLLYGAVEFGKQKGDEKLAATLHGDYVRVHSIQSAEMAQNEEVEIIDRFVKAAKERNIRFCYLRMLTFVGDKPLEANLSFIGNIVNGMRRGSLLTGGGLNTGAAKRYEDTGTGTLIYLLLGIGTAAGTVWTLQLLCPLRERTQIFFLILLGILCAGLAISGETGRRLLALLAGIVFPTAACLCWFPGKEADPERIRSVSESMRAAVVTLFSASAVTAIGIAHVVGLLSTRPFMLRASQFLGIKVQHAIPVLIIAVVALIGGGYIAGESGKRFRERVADRFQSVYQYPLQLGTLLVGLIALAALAPVVARTGNDSGVGVSSFELKSRAVMDKVLPVRPRTKELLVGHPAFVLGIALWMRGRRKLAMPCYVVGSLGQVSLLNTFCHIHTPLIISVWHAVPGLILGTLPCLITFVLLEKLLPVPQKNRA